MELCGVSTIFVWIVCWFALLVWWLNVLYYLRFIRVWLLLIVFICLFACKCVCVCVCVRVFTWWFLCVVNERASNKQQVNQLMFVYIIIRFVRLHMTKKNINYLKHLSNTINVIDSIVQAVAHCAEQHVEWDFSVNFRMQANCLLVIKPTLIHTHTYRHTHTAPKTHVGIPLTRTACHKSIRINWWDVVQFEECGFRDHQKPVSEL